MGVSKPFRRTVRQFKDGEYAEGGRWYYIKHPKFALEPEHYIRAFSVVQKDFITLLDYIEPADTNLTCYSYRIHELFMRTCIEIEANFRAILTENGHKGPRDLTMTDYRKCEMSHRLSSYEIKLPVWQGVHHTRRPFSAWVSAKRLPWYQDYNSAKHSRHGNFDKANFDNLLQAVAGLVAVLSAQFWTVDFSHSSAFLVEDGTSDGFDDAVGGYFRVKFPNDWPDELRYEFDWRNLQKEPDPFQAFPYSEL
jgi:hypothetical protein